MVVRAREMSSQILSKKVKFVKNDKVPEIASQILESYQKSQTYQKCQSLRDSKSDFEMLQQPCDV